MPGIAPKEIYLTVKEGTEFLGFMCRNCTNKTYNQPLVSGTHRCRSCSSPVFVSPTTIKAARQNMIFQRAMWGTEQKEEPCQP